MKVKEFTFEREEGNIEVELYLNGASVKYIEKALKEIDPKYNFYRCLNLIQYGELSLLLIYLGGIIHLKGKKHPVGADWFDEQNIFIFNYLDELSKELYDVMTDNKPTNQGK